MSVRLVSWNLEGRLSRVSTKARGTPEKICQEILSLNADIYIFPEAYDGNCELPDFVDAMFHEHGYVIHDVVYEDSGTRPFPAASSPHIRIMSRIPIKNLTEYRPGNIRTLLYFDTVDPENNQTIRVFAIHLDERSETARRQQMNDIIKCIPAQTSFIMMGDFNSMQMQSLPARLLRLSVVQKVFSMLPDTRILHLAKLAGDMAKGTVLSQLETKTGAINVNGMMRATTTPKLKSIEWIPSIRLIGIDHAVVSPDLQSINFTIQDHDGGSDHRAISVTLNALTKVDNSSTRAENAL